MGSLVKGRFLAWIQPVLVVSTCHLRAVVVEIWTHRVELDSRVVIQVYAQCFCTTSYRFRRLWWCRGHSYLSSGSLPSRSSRHQIRSVDRERRCTRCQVSLRTGDVLSLVSAYLHVDKLKTRRHCTDPESGAVRLSCRARSDLTV